MEIQFPSQNLAVIVLSILVCGTTTFSAVVVLVMLLYRQKQGYRQIEVPASSQGFVGQRSIHDRDLSGSRWLVIARGVGRPVMLKLNPSGNTLGRSKENQMVINDSQVSRFHARIVLTGESWLIADLHSSNGTFVNDEAISIQALNLGDRIRLGENVELVFQA